MSDLKPDYSASVDFLQRWLPRGPWVLVAIDPHKKGIAADTFGGADVSQRDGSGRLLDWLTEQGTRLKRNLYLTANPCRREMKNKPSKPDIAAMSWLFVDLDPSAPPEGADKAAHNAAERERILALLHDLPGGIPKPTSIVASGGGYQAAWRLKLPIMLDGTPEDWTEAERYNRRLEELLGGDHTHNCDRLLRLPGSINRPDPVKVKKGRTEALAAVVEFNDGLHDLDGFEKAEPVRVPASSSNGAVPAVEFDTSSVQRVRDLDAELPPTVPPVVKRIIACGRDEENGDPEREGWSRSEWQWWATCELARRGVKPEVTYSILLDPDWGISNAILVDSKGVQRSTSAAEAYARRQVERAYAEAEDDPLLSEINSRHASVIVGGSSRVLRESWDPLFERRTVEYLRKDAFKDFWNTRRVAVPVARGKSEEVPAGEWWFRHRLRRSYEDVNYAPGVELPEGVYNLWQGFAVSPAEGVCERYLAHVREVICGGVEEHYDYLIRWMAYAVQHPNEPGYVAVVLRGEKGTGKGVFVGHFGALWGRHYVQITNPDHLTKFNSLIEAASVAFLDEATRPDDRRHESILKGMVTEPTVKVERKGIDVVDRKNVLHLILASNDLSVVKATGDERRYFVLDVSSARRGQHAYFKEMEAEMLAGGYGALLKMLLEMDLSGFNVRRAPRTAALQDQVNRNLEPKDQWLLTLLLDGQLPNNVDRMVKGKPQAIPRRAWWGEAVPGNEDGLRHHADKTVPVLRDESNVTLGAFLDDWGITSPEKGGRRSRKFPAAGAAGRVVREARAARLAGRRGRRLAAGRRGRQRGAWVSASPGFSRFDGNQEARNPTAWWCPVDFLLVLPDRRVSACSCARGRLGAQEGSSPVVPLLLSSLTRRSRRSGRKSTGRPSPVGVRHLLVRRPSGEPGDRAPLLAPLGQAQNPGACPSPPVDFLRILPQVHFWSLWAPTYE